MLWYADPHKAIKQHCREDGWVNHPVVSETTNQYGVTTKQTVKKKYITEGNLYCLITHSKLPAAEKFESWVFDEVIPDIRRTGMYAQGGADGSADHQLGDVNGDGKVNIAVALMISRYDAGLINGFGN